MTDEQRDWTPDVSKLPALPEKQHEWITESCAAVEVSMTATIEQLTADLAAVTSERDQLEEAIVSVLGDHDHGFEDVIPCHDILERALLAASPPAPAAEAPIVTVCTDLPINPKTAAALGEMSRLVVEMMESKQAHRREATDEG